MRLLPLVLALVATPALGQRTHKDVTYARRGLEPVKLDVAVPAAPGRFPALVFVHGGTWLGGSKEMHAADIAAAARRGFVGASIDYRLTSPFPAHLIDVRAAIRWLRAHARDYQIDPSRIALVGASAGGHLALLAGLAPNPDAASRVQAVVNVYGPTDLEAFYRASPDFRGALQLVFPSTPLSRQAVHRAASPRTYLSPNAPPLLTLHGTHDEAVPFFTAQLFAAKAMAMGAPHRLVAFPWEKHGFTPAGHQRALEDIFRFAAGALPPR